MKKYVIFQKNHKFLKKLKETAEKNQLLEESYRIYIKTTEISPEKSADMKASRDKTLEIIYNEKILQKIAENNYLLSPNKIKQNVKISSFYTFFKIYIFLTET